MSSLFRLYHTNINPSWFTIATQFGFILGALASSYFGFSDRFSAKRIFVLCALAAAFFNGVILISTTVFTGILLRFLVGVALAGVYPTAIQVLSQFFVNRRGTSVGILVAALTIGSNIPHLILFFSQAIDWQVVIAASSFLSIVAAAVMGLLVPNLHKAKQTNEVSFHLLRQVFRNSHVMRATWGYFGHMWELYAVWTWFALFFHLSAVQWQAASSLSVFISMGICGAIGCVVGGILADRIGKARLAVYAMALSALCCLIIGFTFASDPWLTFVIACVWGFAIIADSAQFSAAIADYAEPAYLGTALTFQMSGGFLITVFSIYLLPEAAIWLTWKYAFMLLAIGPLLGILFMRRLAEKPI